jgi:hypothetical protein
MVLSPEINAGAVGVAAQRTFSIRYGDILIGVIFMGVMVKMAFEGRPRLWMPNPINAGILAYYGMAVYSTGLAFHGGLPSWDGRMALFVLIKMLQFYMVFWMITNAIDTREQIRKQLVAFFISSLVVSIYGIYAMQTENRVSAPFEQGGSEPNTMGGYLTVVMIFAVALIAYLKEFRIRLMLAVTIIFAFVPFLSTLSRASYLALFCGLLAMTMLLKRPIMALVVVVALVTSASIMPDNVRERVNYTFQEGSGVPISVMGRDMGFQLDKSTYERIYVWDKVRFNMRIWPWRGGGVEWERILDSQYARVIIETGLIGLAAFLFMQWRIFKTAREAQLWSSDPVVKALGLGSAAVLVALIVHSMGTISFLIIRIMEPFWMLVAITVVGRSIALEEHRQAYLAELEEEADAAAGEAAPGPAPQPVT